MATPPDPGWSRAVTEDMELNPVGEYEQTKAVADWLILEAVRRGVVVPIVIRPSIVLGADMHHPSLRQLAEFVRHGFFPRRQPRGSRDLYSRR
jgi:nucleoside-diphosphate-sugar epimerase